MIRAITKKHGSFNRTEDDSLFGLLSSYKIFNTYFKLLTSPDKDRIVLIAADNPKNWDGIISERYKNHVPVRRLEIGTNRLFIKYLSPQHLILYFGSILGSKLPTNKVTIINNLDNDGYFILETSVKYKHLIFQSIKKLISLSPQKKYEILEKYIAEAAKR
jgi:triacylglycerol esterase/lipase EstA (alpha/beta hydrolase family)